MDPGCQMSPSPARVGLAGRQFLLHHVANRCRRRRLTAPILVDLLAFLLFHSRAVAQPNASRLRTDLDDLEVVLLVRLQRSRALQRSGRRAEVRSAFIAALA